MAAFNSSPRPRGGVAQLVRALPCHGRGRGFESRRSRHHFSIYLTDHGFLSGGSLEGRQWVDFQALAKLTSSDRRQLLTARRACRPKAAVASSNRTAPSNWCLVAPAFRAQGRGNLTQAVGRALRQACLVAAVAEPISEARRENGLPREVSKNISFPQRLASMISSGTGSSGFVETLRRRWVLSGMSLTTLLCLVTCRFFRHELDQIATPHPEIKQQRERPSRLAADRAARGKGDEVRGRPSIESVARVFLRLTSH